VRLCRVSDDGGGGGAGGAGVVVAVFDACLGGGLLLLSVADVVEAAEEDDVAAGATGLLFSFPSTTPPLPSTPFFALSFALLRTFNTLFLLDTHFANKLSCP
jgi:hypothetical protein